MTDQEIQALINKAWSECGLPANTSDRLEAFKIGIATGIAFAMKPKAKADEPAPDETKSED